MLAGAESAFCRQAAGISEVNALRDDAQWMLKPPAPATMNVLFMRLGWEAHHYNYFANLDLIKWLITNVSNLGSPGIRAYTHLKTDDFIKKAKFT